MKNVPLWGFQKEASLGAFKLWYPWGTSSYCGTQFYPWAPAALQVLADELQPQRLLRSWSPGNLKLFRPPEFWWLLSLSERGGERVSWQESRWCSAGALARWVKITIIFPEWAIFNGKLFLSEFFCPAFPSGLLVMVVHTLLCRSGVLPSLSPMGSKFSCLTSALGKSGKVIFQAEVSQAAETFLMGSESLGLQDSYPVVPRSHCTSISS